MDREDKIELIKLQGEVDKRVRENALERYAPYKKQKEFHKLGAKYNERCLMAANQVGKCATLSTTCDTSEGPRRMSEIWGRDNIEVLTYPNNEPRRVVAWVRKPAEECYRITMSDGRWFECPEGHRVLTTSGYVSVQQLLASSVSRPQTSSVLGLLVRALDVQRWCGKLRGWMGRCLMDSRLDGGQLLSDEDNVQVFVPSQDGVRKHNPFSFGWGDRGSIYTGTLLQGMHLLSSLGGVNHLWGRYAASLVQVFSPVFQRMSKSIQTLSLSGGFAHPDQTIHADDLRSFQFSSLEFPSIDGNHIVSVESIGVHTLYDMQVEDRHNYMAAGLVHHNTWAGAMEAAYHATGLYPDWWEGRRFSVANVGWVGGVSGEVIRDTTQRLLCGRIDAQEIGQGSIPANLIKGMQRAHGVPGLLDHVKIEHIDGGISLIYFKSYEKGRLKFQGETIHWFWPDEEPPADIYSEGRTRTQKNGICVFMTYTPLLGMSTVTSQFLQNPTSQQVVTNMTIEDAEHYTEEERRIIIESYPAHERESRAKGIPALGSGRIFPVAEEIIIEAPLREIPKEWVMLNGLDFGWDHPQAAVCLAWDRDADVVHITKEFRQRECTPIYGAAALNKWGKHPTAWPHDGYQHDKGSGLQLARQYREAGLNMLHKHATHKSGGFGTEAGIMDMLDRMMTGRLKVGSNLLQWFEEYRMYHRKDGQIVKERDDLMSATRIALMMLRYADNMHVTTRKMVFTHAFA